MRMFRSLKTGVAAIAVLAALPAAAHAAPLSAGVGIADITPQTGYYLGGWTRADRTSHGQHTRLHSRALVLKEGSRKVVLVQGDLFMIPAGMQKQIAAMGASRGFREDNVLISASHTHSGPGGFANFKTFNTAAPSLQTATDPISFYRLLDPKPADPQLYPFLRTRSRPPSGGPTQTSVPPRPAGARPPSRGSPRPARSRLTSPTTGSLRTSGRAAPRRTRSGSRPRSMPG